MITTFIDYTFTAETIQPYSADTVKPYTAEPIESNTAETPKPRGTPKPTKTPRTVPPAPESYEWAFKTFILWVPGTSFSVDNYDRQTSTIYTSPGTQPKSAITIQKNGTYVWNSAWDAKIITGNRKIGSDDNIKLSKGEKERPGFLRKEMAKMKTSSCRTVISGIAARSSH